MKVCFETFGCRLNKAEALQQEADYAAKGWEITDSPRPKPYFLGKPSMMRCLLRFQSTIT